MGGCSHASGRPLTRVRRSKVQCAGMADHDRARVSERAVALTRRVRITPSSALWDYRLWLSQGRHLGYSGCLKLAQGSPRYKGSARPLVEVYLNTEFGCIGGKVPSVFSHYRISVSRCPDNALRPRLCSVTIWAGHAPRAQWNRTFVEAARRNSRRQQSMPQPKKPGPSGRGDGTLQRQGPPGRRSITSRSTRASSACR